MTDPRGEAHEPFSRQELDATLADLKTMWGALADLAMSVPGAKEVVGPRKDLPETIGMIFAQAATNASLQSAAAPPPANARAVAEKLTAKQLADAAHFLGLDDCIENVTPYGYVGEMLQHIVQRAAATLPEAPRPLTDDDLQ